MTSARDGYFTLKRSLRTDAGPRDVSDIRALQGMEVRALASAAFDEISRWVTPYPSFLLNRLRSLSLTCAAMWPAIDVSVVATVMKVPVLLFAIDDIVDGTRTVPRDDEAGSLLAACEDIALAGGRFDLASRMASLAPPLSANILAPWSEAGRACQRYCNELSALPGARYYYPFFAQIFASAMAGMRSELVARRIFIETGAVPAYQPYMETGKHSIGAPALFAAALVALGPEIEPDELQESWQAVNDFALAGGSCIRLANDVRSFARETEIEQRPNSMLILMRAEGMSEQDAERLVISRADAHLAAMRPLAQRLPASLHPWAEGVERFTSLIRDWYMVRELHE